MNKDNKNTELDNKDEKLHISDVISMLPTDKDVREFLKNGAMGIERNYIGTYQYQRGEFVGHIFERLN